MVKKRYVGLFVAGAAATFFIASRADARACKVAIDEDGGMHDAGCEMDEADAGTTDAGPPPPPWVPPPMPEPEENPECECNKESTTTTNGPYTIPTIGHTWTDVMGPGQSVGFFITGSYTSSEFKSPCACFERKTKDGRVGLSVQVGPRGFQATGSYSSTDVACQTPDCPEGGQHVCVAPSGTRNNENWSASGGAVFQIPWEALAPTICASRFVSCNGEIAVNLGVSGGKDVSTGNAYCSACAEGLDLHHVSAYGSIAGRGEIEVGVPWIFSGQLGVEIEGGVRYREYGGNNCGTAVSEKDICGWLRARIYGNACFFLICIDGERELFSIGEECRVNSPPGMPLPPRQ